MAGFNPQDYVDVAERVRIFNGKYPLGSLQSEMTFVDGGVLCKAYAYRTPDDERPGIGHAFEPIPGKTQFTKDSEVMNAETSAWGRAIVALGFETKKVASADEVRNRQGEPSVAPAGDAQDPSPAASPPPAGATDPQRERLAALGVSLLSAGHISEAAAKKVDASAGDANLTRDKAREIIDALDKIEREKAKV